jgi:hypothetical protein
LTNISAALGASANAAQGSGSAPAEQALQGTPSQSTASNSPTTQTVAGAAASQPAGTILSSTSGPGAIGGKVDQSQSGATTAPDNPAGPATTKGGDFGNPSPTPAPQAATPPVPAAGASDSAAHSQPGQSPATQAPADTANRSPAIAQPAAPFTPLATHKTATEWVISAHVSKDKIARLSGRDMIATPAIKAAAAANVAVMAVAAGDPEIMAFGYLMPDGSIQVRLAQGQPGDVMYKAHPSGPGKVIFGIHGHPDDAVGMVDDPSKDDGFGDTDALFKRGIPMATVFRGQIGWHEMVKGQLTFTAPTGAFADSQRQSIQSNLNWSQDKFLKPKPKKVK